MYRKMKAVEFLTFIGRLKGMDQKSATESAQSLLQELELDTRGGSKIEEYSRGMQQKLQFAARWSTGPSC